VDKEEKVAEKVEKKVMGKAEKKVNNTS